MAEKEEQLKMMLDELVKRKVITNSRASAVQNAYEWETDPDKKEEIFRKVKASYDSVVGLEKEAKELMDEEARYKLRRRGLKRTLTRMVNAGIITKEAAEKVLESYDKADYEGKEAILEQYYIDYEGRYYGPTIHRKPAGVEEEEIEEAETIEVPKKEVSLEKLIDDFAASCNEVAGYSGMRREDVRGLATGFYIMKDGDPVAVHPGETASEAYFRTVTENPGSDIVLVCNVFPNKGYKDDINRLEFETSKVLRQALPEKQAEYFERVFKRAIEKDLMMVKPDYARVFFKPEGPEGEGVIWIEGATYTSEVLPEKKGRGVKAFDIYRVEGMDKIINVERKRIFGYNVPYSKKTHRYPVDAFCLVNEEAEFCVTKEATLIVRKR